MATMDTIKRVGAARELPRCRGRRLADKVTGGGGAGAESSDTSAARR